MNDNAKKRSFSRRQFLRLGSGVLGTAAAAALLPRGKALLLPDRVESKTVEAAALDGPSSETLAAARAQAAAGVDFHFAATDGWIYLPEDAVVPPYHPDNYAPDGLTTYIFGFRDVTGFTNDQVFDQKMKAQLTAPTFGLQCGQDWTLKLTNLGLAVRPDLIDAHTLHFHGFRNAIPIFDGEPHSSVGVPIVRDLTYFYRPHDPGTYMYHCHFEETEHVHMGMVGVAYIKPEAWTAAAKMAYDPGSIDTSYDREFVQCLNEVWTESHWADSHVQLPEWSDYAPEFWLLNGRVYPDTVAPNGSRNMTTGDLNAPPGRPELQYQPISSLVTCNSGDRVLLRFVNLGFEAQSMKLTGLKMHIIAKDATLLQGRSGEDLTYWSDTVTLGPGQSTDAIFVAPDVSELTKLLIYNRKYSRLSNGGHSGYGGQMTEIHIYPTTSPLPDQTEPNA